MNARPSLLIISISRIASDPRVLKQVELFRDSYDVFTCGSGPLVDGVAEHFELSPDARGWVSDRVALITRSYRRAYQELPAVREALALLPRERFDVIIANDLNTVPLALTVGAKRGIHADLHEFAPREKENELLWRLFVAPFQRWLCRTTLPRVSSATTVGAGIALEYEKDYGVPFGVVTNAAPFADRSPRPAGRPLRLIHSGAAQRYRRLENYLDAMVGAPDGVELTMMLMPNEPGYLEELRERGSRIPGVTFREPVSYGQLVETIAEYDLSLSVLPPGNFNLANALPNKFFEAVQARVGLIIGPSPEMARILSAHGLGAVTDDFTVPALQRVIQGLDPEQVDTWKRNAHAAAHELSAENQVREWARAVERILAG